MSVQGSIMGVIRGILGVPTIARMGTRGCSSGSKGQGFRT